MKILHLINSLEIGGAEKMLLKLCKEDAFVRDEIIIVTLLNANTLANEIDSSRNVISLGLSWRPDSWLFIFRFAKIVIEHKPDVIQSWLYHSDLVAGIVGRIFHVPVIWGVRQSNLSKTHNKFSTRLIIKLCALSSHFLPHKAITNSEKAKRVHIEAGYADIFTVIPNGFDLEVFFPSSLSAKNIRAELGIRPNSMIIGMVGRFDAQKNHAGFFKAAAWILEAFPELHFCLVGTGINYENQKLKKIINRSKVPPSQLHMLGARDDIPYVMAGFDVLGLPSSGESFPNVLGEAMASGVPCVVTDVGDCAVIVGDTGRVVASGDMKQFANEVIDILSLPANDRKQLGTKARQRIKLMYTLDRSAKLFRDIYKGAIEQKN